MPIASAASARRRVASLHAVTQPEQLGDESPMDAPRRSRRGSRAPSRVLAGRDRRAPSPRIACREDRAGIAAAHRDHDVGLCAPPRRSAASETPRSVDTELLPSPRPPAGLTRLAGVASGRAHVDRVPRSGASRARPPSGSGPRCGRRRTAPQAAPFIGGPEHVAERVDRLRNQPVVGPRAPGLASTSPASRRIRRWWEIVGCESSNAAVRSQTQTASVVLSRLTIATRVGSLKRLERRRQVLGRGRVGHGRLVACAADRLEHGKGFIDGRQSNT